MSLVTGKSLDPDKFFTGGQPVAQGSSFDLTIGSIFDHKGKKVEGLFTLKPNQMVQVVSAEKFNLSARFTGHVTYKTTLTKKGIWALTVGIVDPGWVGPIATTLLNFSRVDHTITIGDPFLRVSFFEHEPVEKLRETPPLDQYLKDIQKTAASMLPSTFLDSGKIAEVAGDKVLEKIRTQALTWVVAIVFLFTASQFAINIARPTEGIERLRVEIESMRTRLQKFEQENARAVEPRVATPPTLPNPALSPSPTPPMNKQD